ncbi:hypothetical protein Tco_0173814 [Tanacetum coccineum]
MVNGFVVGTVIDVPFAGNTIRDVIESIFYHHYVHDITEEEVAFNRPFATYRDDRRWKPNELRLMGRTQRIKTSELVKIMLNGFVVGTVIDVPFAENTIKDVIEFIFYHHYVHDITEEVAFNRPFATYRDDPMHKFELACAGVHFGIDKLIHVFVINIVITYNEDFTFKRFRDHLGLWGGNLTHVEDVLLRLLDGLWDFV